jgi:creatinine amidohydrolase/Fe(II)-dependent formamide hydrolase-like protein
VLGDPRGATAAHGEAYLDATVTKLVGVLEEIATFELPTVGARVTV